MEHGEGVFIHPTADIAADVRIGIGTRIWQNVQVMGNVAIGKNCTISKGVILSEGTQIGDSVIIDNYANLFAAIVEAAAFIGPMACVLHDPSPRAVNEQGHRRQRSELVGLVATVKRGASLGAGSIVMPGVIIGSYANVCAGAVVSRDVPDHVIVAGHPARQIGYACRCGRRLDDALTCECGLRFQIESPTDAPRLVEHRI